MRTRLVALIVVAALFTAAPSPTTAAPATPATAAPISVDVWTLAAPGMHMEAPATPATMYLADGGAQTPEDARIIKAPELWEAGWKPTPGNGELDVLEYGVVAAIADADYGFHGGRNNPDAMAQANQQITRTPFGWTRGANLRPWLHSKADGVTVYTFANPDGNPMQDGSVAVVRVDFADTMDSSPSPYGVRSTRALWLSPTDTSEYNLVRIRTQFAFPARSLATSYTSAGELGSFYVMTGY